MDSSSSEQPIQTGATESEKERRQKDFRDECDQIVREVLCASQTLVERIKQYALALAYLCVIAVAVGALKPLLGLGVSSEFIRAAEISTRVLLVVVGGCLLVGFLLFRRSEAEEKRVQALLEQKTTALLSAPPNSSQAVSLAAEVDAIMCYIHMNDMSNSSVEDYLRVQDNIYEDMMSERDWFGPLYSEWLGEAGGRESFSCLHSYRVSFSSFDDYKSQTTKILRSFGMPKMLCSSDAAVRWISFPFVFPLQIFDWFVPQKDTEAAPDETPNPIAELVDSLLRSYVRCHGDVVPSLTLSQSQPLGEFGTDDNNRDLAKAGLFHQMSNRLKVLANLNPVLYQEPVTATLTVTIDNKATGELRDESLRLYFDDRADDPFCRVEMDQTS